MLKFFAALGSFLLCASAIAADIQSHDHFISATSLAPSLKNQKIKLYLREVSPTKRPLLGTVLFIHGSGTPSQPAFDIDYQDYSWMAYLAKAGFATYAVDLTGYGRSTRPAEMENPCNLRESEQQQLIPSLIKKTCAQIHSQPLTTLESDWGDMDAAVNFIRQREHVSSLALIGWSQGGPRGFGYARRHPGAISKLVMLAPAYHRDTLLTPTTPKDGFQQLMWAQNQTEFVTGWKNQTGCNDQYDQAITPIIWKSIQDSDSLGAQWGTGLRRAPEQDKTWGFNQSTAQAFTLPTLLIAGEFDKQVMPLKVQQLYEDLASTQKVLINLACSSHRALWESNHSHLFKASLEWLKASSVMGQSKGILRLGDAKPAPTSTPASDL